jgi:hypothetical protein
LGEGITDIHSGTGHQERRQDSGLKNFNSADFCGSFDEILEISTLTTIVSVCADTMADKIWSKKIGFFLDFLISRDILIIGLEENSPLILCQSLPVVGAICPSKVRNFYLRRKFEKKVCVFYQG